MSNLLHIWKMTFLYDKHYTQGTIVAMEAKMPKVGILTEYGLLPDPIARLTFDDVMFLFIICS